MHALSPRKSLGPTGLSDLLLYPEVTSLCDFRPERALQARLVQLFAARELGIDMDTASWRLRQLTLLLPDMGALPACRLIRPLRQLTLLLRHARQWPT